MLYHLDGFREKVLAFENGYPGTRALKAIFQEMQKSDVAVVDIHTDAMAKTLWKGCLRIENLSRQEDAAEFISNCVMERSKNEGASSFINSIFFKEQLIKQCIRPNKTKYGRTIVAGDNEYKSVLDLKVTGNSVDALFTNYFKEKIQEREIREKPYTPEERQEYVDGIGEYPAGYPGEGKRKRPTTFCHDDEIVEHYALSEIGEYLLVKLPRYTALGGKYRGVINLNKSLRIPVGDKQAVLSLEGFVVHIGPSPAGGHYVYYGKKSNRGMNDWYLFNDSTVSALTCDDGPSVKFLSKEEKVFTARLRSKVRGNPEDTTTNNLINKNAVLLSYKVVNYSDLDQTTIDMEPLDESENVAKLFSLGYNLNKVKNEYSRNRRYNAALERLQALPAALAVAAPVATPKGTRKLTNLVREQRERQKAANEAAARNLQIKQDAEDASRVKQEEEDAAFAAALSKE